MCDNMAPSLSEGWVSRAETSGLASLQGPVLRFRSGAGKEDGKLGSNEGGQRRPAAEGRSRVPGLSGTMVSRRLYEWHELSEWQQRGSSHLETGYRKASGSVASCLWSWTYLHNESVNIYSHIIGAALFLYFPYHAFATEVSPRHATASATDIIVCSAWFVGVAICFILSVCFHSLMSHSEPYYLNLIILDYLGVLVLMHSATIPLIHYTLQCYSPVLRGTYHAVTALLALACGVVTVHPNMGAVHLGPRRAVLFSCFGCGSFLLPIMHGVWAHGWTVQERLGGWFVGGTAAGNAVGMGAYMAKFPETWWPRRFDIFGASHQLMHIFVLIAAFSYSKAVLMAFDYRHSEGGKCFV